MKRQAALGVACSILAIWTVACRGNQLPDPSPGNQAPTGYIDTPRDGETVGRTVEVSGWALDDGGAVRIRVYVDGRFSAATDLTVARPDVTKAFPQSADRGDLHGWRVTVDLGPDDTPHVITAQAIDLDGAARDLGTIGVKVISR